MLYVCSMYSLIKSQIILHFYPKQNVEIQRIIFFLMSSTILILLLSCSSYFYECCHIASTKDDYLNKFNQVMTKLRGHQYTTSLTFPQSLTFFIKKIYINILFFIQMEVQMTIIKRRPEEIEPHLVIINQLLLKR